MKRVRGADDLESAFVVAEFARQLEKALVGFTAAVAEKTFARPEQAHQRLGQPPLRLMIIEVRDMNELAGLLDQRFGNRRVRMSQPADRNATAQVKITLAGHIVEITAGAVTQHDVEAAVARDDMLLKQRLDGGHIVAHKRRRRRN